MGHASMALDGMARPWVRAKRGKRGMGGALFTTSHLHYPFSAEPLSRICSSAAAAAVFVVVVVVLGRGIDRILSLSASICPPFFVYPSSLATPAKQSLGTLPLNSPPKKKKEGDEQSPILGHRRTRHHHGRRPPPVQGHVPVHEEGHGRRPPRHDDSRSSRCRCLGDDGRGALALRWHHLQAASARPPLPRHGQGPRRPVGPPRPRRLPGRRRLGRRLLDPFGPAAQVRQGQAAHRPPPRGPGRRGLAVPRQG